MNQRISILLVLTLLLIVPPASAGCVKFTQTTMEFERTDAVFTLDYELDLLVKIYVMAFGSAKIVPEIEAQFAPFNEDDVTIVRLDYEQAVVVIKNVSYYEKEYYFHDPHEFGMTTDKLIVDPHDGSLRIYLNANSTPSLYYADVWG